MEQNRPTANITQNVQRRNAREINLVELFYVLLHNWKPLLLAGVLGAVIMAGYYGMFVQNTYEATTKLYITNTDSVISFQDLQIGSALTEDYKTIIVSETVLDKVISDLQLDVDYEDLQKLITVSNPAGTHIITTSVRTTDVETSRNIANDLLNVSIEQIYQIVGTGKPTIIDYSKAERVKNVTPSLSKFILIGVLLGMMLVAAFIVIRMVMDDSIRSDDDITKYLQLTVLSSIPYDDN